MKFEAFLLFPMAFLFSEAQNLNCAIIIPPNPLTAQGLSTPFYYTALNPQDGICDQSNSLQSSFVEGMILNLDNGTISIYNPLIINLGSTPEINPVVPNLPAHYVAGLWFGTVIASSSDLVLRLKCKFSNSSPFKLEYLSRQS